MQVIYLASRKAHSCIYSLIHLFSAYLLNTYLSDLVMGTEDPAVDESGQGLPSWSSCSKNHIRSYLSKAL